jgi:hypothetical protein
VLIRPPVHEPKRMSAKPTVACQVRDGAQVNRLLAKSKEYLLFESSGGCVGCALSLACEFFQSAAEDPLIADIGCLRGDPVFVTSRAESIVEFERNGQISGSLGKSSHASGAVFYRPDGTHGAFAARLSCYVGSAWLCRKSIGVFRVTAVREAPP